MGILTRFKDIMASNVNALLDKAEDPEKMIDQYMRNLQSDLGKVKAETASVMADESRAKRELDENTAEINKMQAYAEKAGNEDDARKFLEKKAALSKTNETLQKTYDMAAANSAKMRQMHDKLVTDMNSLEERRNAIKATVRAAKAQKDMNKMTSKTNMTGDSMAAFDRMEEKANRMLDEANAMDQLNQSEASESVNDLAAKYDAAPEASGVDDELAALKAKMGL